MNYIKVTCENGLTEYISIYSIHYLREVPKVGTFICTQKGKRTTDFGIYVKEDIETVYARIQESKKR